MMLGMDLNMPVTLVVKAPNQKFGDLTVECALGWTIRKLKEHLANVYPNKPKQDDQRLIYSGRLLLDHLTLKDVLRQYDESQTTHTVHLVCSQVENASEGSTTPSTGSSSPSTSPATSPRSTTDGVRQRHRRQDSADTPVTTEPPPVYPGAPHDAFQQLYGGLDAHLAASGFYPGMMPGPMMAYSPEQMQWMQQMYAQQMAQFMNLYQTGYPTTPEMPTVPEADVGVPPAEENNAPNRPANQRPAGDGPIRMNAQGGPVMDDDEDEANRDWLDWVYTLCRFMVLISIVYFYSTLGRFVLVFGFFFVIYLYQAGYLRLNPGPNEQRQRQHENREGHQQQVPQPQAQGQEDNREDEDDSSSSGEDGANDIPEEPAPEPPQPPQPGALAIAWSFIFTFFSSLIPQQPAAVNAN